LRYKKGAALLTAATVLLNTFTFTYAQTPFTDIENSWAKTHIINVYEKGLMEGTSGDKFSPNAVITKYNAIKSIARMMGTDLMDLDDVVAKYKSVLDKFNVPSDFRKEVAFFLERGILQSEFDLDRMNTMPNASKLDVCIYLGRALGVSDENYDDIVALTYKDTLQIPSLYHKYVAYMIKIGAVNSKGDQEGKFNPGNPATRDMFAKMLDIASSEYVKTDIGTGSTDPSVWTPAGEIPSDITDIEQTETAPGDDIIGVEIVDKGIIDTITYKRDSQPKILLERENKELVEYTVPEDLMKENIIVNGQLGDVYSLRPGLFVEVKAISGVVDRITTLEMKKDVFVLADIVEVNVLENIMYVKIDDGEGTISEKKVFLNDTKVADTALNILTIDSLAPGQRINLTGVEDIEGIRAQSIIINY